MWGCMDELCGNAWMNYVGMHEEREERKGSMRREEEA